VPLTAVIGISSRKAVSPSEEDFAEEDLVERWSVPLADLAAG
jgi:hypothetical protein